MASKEDPAVQFWEFVQENLLQFHCENVSWEQASDKIPIKVIVELLGDLITHVNTCLLLRNNRLLFTLNWETIENGQVVWEHLHSFHLNQKRRLETPQYQCDYMLTSVSSYPDLADTYCYAFDKQSHPSFVREDIFEPGQLPVSESIEVWYLPPQFGSTPYHPQSNGQCERFNSTLCNMLGTLSDEEKSDWKLHLGCMTHAYNCTKHASTTYSPYYLMFGRHPRLPIDVAFGLHKPNCSDNCSKSRYIQKLRRRLNYAHKKASKYSSEQAQKYKTSYDKSVKGPQLQVNDLVLVKIVAHKARHKIQDKWESEEYIVIEQPIPGTPVYRVRPVTGTKVRTLHRNLLLPLGVKYQPDIDSYESDSDDSVCVDTSHSRSNQPEKAYSQAKSIRFQS